VGVDPSASPTGGSSAPSPDRRESSPPAPPVGGTGSATAPFPAFTGPHNRHGGTGPRRGEAPRRADDPPQDGASSQAAGAAPAPSRRNGESAWDPGARVARTEPATEPASAAAGTDRAAGSPAGAPATVGGPSWSRSALARLGLPSLVTDAVAGLNPGDDLGWVEAVAVAVEPLCRPLPEGEQVLAGPLAPTVGSALGLPTRRPPSAVSVRGSFCAAVGDSREERSWLAAVADGRWVHLVAGGGSWRGLLFNEPKAVSWTDASGAAEAIRLAAELDLVLGYDASDGSAPPRRANPTDLAVAIRAALPRR